MKLSNSYKSALRLFTYYYANGTLAYTSGVSGLLNIDYIEQLNETPSNFEMVFAVFSNNIEMDENGTVINFEHSIKRASQFVMLACNGSYVVDPDFEDWEIALY